MASAARRKASRDSSPVSRWARAGTDLAVEDTDGDGSVDGEEVYAGTGPLT